MHFGGFRYGIYIIHTYTMYNAIINYPFNFALQHFYIFVCLISQNNLVGFVRAILQAALCTHTETFTCVYQRSDIIIINIQSHICFICSMYSYISFLLSSINVRFEIKLELVYSGTCNKPRRNNIYCVFHQYVKGKWAFTGTTQVPFSKIIFVTVQKPYTCFMRTTFLNSKQFFVKV